MKYVIPPLIGLVVGVVISLVLWKTIHKPLGAFSVAPQFDPTGRVVHDIYLDRDMQAESFGRLIPGQIVIVRIHQDKKGLHFFGFPSTFHDSMRIEPQLGTTAPLTIAIQAFVAKDQNQAYALDSGAPLTMALDRGFGSRR